MRLWLLSLGAVLAFGVCGYVLVQYVGSRFDDTARWLGATPSIEFVKSAVADLQSKNISAVEGKLDRSYVNEQSRSGFAKISSELPSSPPDSVRLASWWSTHALNDTKTVWHSMLSLEYGFDGKWFLVNARVRTKEGEPPILEWFNFQPLPESLENINRLSLQGMRGVHFVFLAVSIAIATCSAAALILCSRQKMPIWRKIIWLIGILSGFGKFGLDWTSGSLKLQLLSINIPAVGFWRASPLAPYIFWFSVPVFSIVFLVHHLQSPPQVEMDADRRFPSRS